MNHLRALQQSISQRKEFPVRITHVETFLVRPRWVFVRVRTDEGVTGWGEPGGEARSGAVAATVHDMADYLVGQNPLTIERHWQRLTKGAFFRGGVILSSAVAGIDQALWDIAGKVHGVPVHELLGGPVRDRMRVYAWIGGDRTGDYSPDEIAAEASDQVSRGFTALKMTASSEMVPLDTPAKADGVIARLEAVRNAIGRDRDIAIDFHGRISRAMSRRLLPLVEPYQPLFVEEPCLPEYPEAFKELAQLSSVPIATGERLCSRWEFKHVVQSGIAVVQPDPSHAGGISETRRIATMAEAYDVLLAPHSAIGPIALAASLQVDFASPNALIQEQGVGYSDPGLDNAGSDILDYLVDRSVFEYREGFVSRPRNPGLGIEIDEVAVERAARQGHAWKPAPWTYPDGSFAES
jgi:galactonate dehydratase